MLNISLWVLPRRLLLSALLLLSFLAVFVPASPVYAAGITVTGSGDTQADEGVCTLREAIVAANTDTVSGVTAGECAAGSGADAITFDNDYTITLSSQLPAVTTEMTITGNGAANTIVQANAATNTATYRVFEVTGTGNLTLNSLTVRHGRCNGSCATAVRDGGGIFSAGTLLLDAVTVSSNRAVWSGSSGLGGGIYSTGTLTVQTGSTIGGASAGNTAGYGGGIYVASGLVTVDASTVSANNTLRGGGNYEPGGGGIYHASGTLTIQNGSLIGGAGTGNSTGMTGGGLYIGGGTVTIDASTVSANSASYGGGIHNHNGTLTIQNGSAIGGTGVGNSLTYNFGSGNAVYNTGGTLTISGTRILANTSAYTNLTTLYRTAGSVSITGSCIASNSGSPTISNGGGGTLIATGNWWGDPGGPGVGNANTVSAGWDTSGYLTSESMDCYAGPASLSATTVSDTQIDLSWIDAPNDETEFRIERSLDATDWTEIAVPAADSTSYQDTGVSCGTTYFYRARSYRTSGSLYSPYSNTASATTTTVSCTPGSLTVTSNLDGTLGALNSNGTCELREAIINANANNQSGSTECSSGSGVDTITFDADYTITLTSQLPAVTSSTFITGNGAANTILQANASSNTANYRVLEVKPSGNLTLSGVTVRHGRCNGSCATATNNGGGIYSAGIMLLDGVTVNSNTVTWSTTGGYGGGVYSNGTLTIQNGSLIGGAGSGNSAYYGGGLAMASGTTTVNASTVSANTANTFGGGIYSNGTLTIQNGSLIGGAGAANSAQSGAGIYMVSGSTTVNASTVSANTVTNSGGGIYSSGTLTIQNGSVIGGAGAGNSSGGDGGGVFLNSGTATIDASTISANTVTFSGGGIFSGNSGITLTIQNGSVIGGAGAGNSAGSHGGGLSAAGTTTVNASTISANTATANGGGIRNSNGTLTIQNGSVIGGTGAGNSAANGGGLYGNNVTISSSTISANTATGNGGGLSVGGTNTVNASTISANTAANGGGLHAGGITISSSTISANTATSNGGGIYGSGTVTITTSRIMANMAGTNGGAFYRSTGTVTVTGTCIAGNSSTAFHNTLTTQQTATGNWWGDPLGPGGVGPGAGDSVSNYWNYLGFLTSASLDCGGAPGGLTASPSDVDKIDLAWVDGATDESEFRIERSPDGSTGWIEIAQPAANATTYQDTGLDCWTTYYYRGRAYRSTGSLYSGYTAVASASPCAPTKLDLSQITQTNARLTWMDNSGDETEFRVENSLDGSTGWVEIAQPAANSTSYPISGLSCSTTSYYRVRAYRTTGGLYSEYTNVLQVATVPCMVADGSLEIDANSNYLPDRWAGAGLILGSINDGRDCSVGAALIGSCSMRIKGNGTAKDLFQVIYLKRRGLYQPTYGAGSIRYTFSTASKADSANGAGVYQAVVTFYLMDNTTVTKVLTFTGGTHAFETKTTTFYISSQAYAVVVSLSYGKSGGTVWFDNVSLSSP